jgi:capsular polysaccharide biosynthesis protein
VPFLSRHEICHTTSGRKDSTSEVLLKQSNLTRVITSFRSQSNAVFNFSGSLRRINSASNNDMSRVSISQVHAQFRPEQSCQVFSVEQLRAWQSSGSCNSSEIVTPTAYWIEPFLHTPVPFIFIRNAFVLVGRGVVMDIESKTVFDLNGGCCLQTAKKYEANMTMDSPRHINSFSTEGLEIVVLIAHSHCCGSYYHLLAETLPRVLAAAAIFQEVPLTSFRFDNPLSDTSFLHKAFARVREVAQLDSQSLHWHSEELVYPLLMLPPIHTKLKQNKNVNQMIRELLTLTSESCAPRTRGSKKLIMLRRSRRAVLNFGELVAAINELEISIDLIYVDADDVAKLSIHETACLFKDACGLVSGHGGQITNVLYLPENAFVVELVVSEQNGRVYGGLSASLNLKYTSTEEYMTREAQSAGHYANAYITDVRKVANMVHDLIMHHC